MTTKTSGETVRCRVVYAGRVQGVCFRATTAELSREAAVVGYVRNRPDGTVELEAEGAARDVEALLSAVATEYSGFITDAQRSAVAPRGDETRFEIRY